MNNLKYRAMLFITNCEIYGISFMINKLNLKIQRYRELGRSAEITDLMTEQYDLNKKLFIKYNTRSRIINLIED